jgi:hypothetical protein
LSQDDMRFSRSETQVFLRGDESPKVIGHVNDWRGLTTKQPKAELDLR